MQQIGNSIGVAVTGVIFFGAVRHGYAHAFGLSVIELGVRAARPSPASAGCCPARPARDQEYSRS